MNDYWESRFGNGGKVWGSNPSGTAPLAKEIFKAYGIHDILVIGSGYGRNSNYFYDEGFEVEGIEYSKEGIKIAREDNPNIKYYYGSVFDMPFREEKYSGIYCYNVLHLFMKDLRIDLLERCKAVLKDGGIMYFTGFSEEEVSFGTGRQLEANTFESKLDKPIHYYNDKDMKEEFKTFKIIETGLFSEQESHGDEGEHEHILRFIGVQKVCV